MIPLEAEFPYTIRVVSEVLSSNGSSSMNLNIIIGKNAQGKTNLIEAVFLSSIGKSFRTSKESDLIKFGEENAIVRVSAGKKVIDTRVEIFIRKNFKKAIKKDGNTVRKTSELKDNIIIGGNKRIERLEDVARNSIRYRLL